MPTTIVSFGRNNGSYVVYLYAATTATMNTKHILVLNGPNLNAIGRREPEIYGQQSFDSYAKKLKEQFPNLEIRLYQSNHEGAIIDKLYEEEEQSESLGVVLNAGAYTHTSLALADAIRSIELPVVEVHISNTAARDKIRQQSLIAAACKGSITGFGLHSYALAIQALLFLHHNDTHK